MDGSGGENPDRQVRRDGRGRFSREDENSREEVPTRGVSRELASPPSRSRRVPLAVDVEGRVHQSAEHAAPVLAREAEDQET